MVGNMDKFRKGDVVFHATMSDNIIGGFSIRKGKVDSYVTPSYMRRLGKRQLVQVTFEEGYLEVVAEWQCFTSLYDAKDSLYAHIAQDIRLLEDSRNRLERLHYL
jgi:hypothetical protein